MPLPSLLDPAATSPAAFGRNGPRALPPTAQRRYTVAADALGGTLAVQKQAQPNGEAGSLFSLMKVAEKIVEGKNHPAVRSWTTKLLAKHGNPKGAHARAKIILEALHPNGKSRWVPDPTGAEMIPGAHLILGDGDNPPYFALGDCFPQGTLVLGEGHTLRPIESLREGMAIWGLDRWSTVQRVAFKGELSVDCIRLNNGSDVKLTADHHVYVLDCREHPMLDDGEEPRALPNDTHWRGTSDTFGCSCRATERVEKRTRVAELRRGMVMPAPDRIPFGTEAMDPDTAWVEGLYVADGWSEATRFGISGQDGCPKEEQKRAVQAICEKRGIATRWHRKYLSVIDADWALRMQQMGTHAPQKHLLSVNLDEGSAAATLRGVMADSGKNTRGEQRTFTTTSRELAVQTRLLHRMFGITCGWRYIENHGGLGSNAIYRLGTRGNSRNDGRGTWLLRVRDIDRDVAKLPCWDITTDDHRVYLPEHDVTVSQCDDLTTGWGAAVLTALMMLSAAESVGVLAAVVGHSYQKNGVIEHVLGALYDQGKWWYAEPSIPDMPFGEAKTPTREYVIDVPSLEVLCDAAVCLMPGGQASTAPPPPRHGDFLSVNGVATPDPAEEAMGMDADNRALLDYADMTGICHATVTEARDVTLQEVLNQAQYAMWARAFVKTPDQPVLWHVPDFPVEQDRVAQSEIEVPWNDGIEPRTGANWTVPNSGFFPNNGDW